MSLLLSQLETAKRTWRLCPSSSRSWLSYFSVCAQTPLFCLHTFPVRTPVTVVIFGCDPEPRICFAEKHSFFFSTQNSLKYNVSAIRRSERGADA